MAEKKFEMRIQPRWSDQDLMGHVNNAKLVTYVEEVRINALNAWVRGASSQRPGVVLRVLNVDFLAPVAYSEEIIGTAWLTKVGNSSYVMQHALEQGGTTCVTAEGVLVSFDTKTQKKAELPTEIREMLEAHLVEPGQ